MADFVFTVRWVGVDMASGQWIINSEDNKWSKKAEKKSQELLQTMVTKGQYKKYLDHDYLSYQAESDRCYYIYKGDSQISIRTQDEKGFFGHACLVLEDRNIPPTDSVIMRLVLLQSDEENFYKKATTSTSSPKEYLRKYVYKNH